MTKSQKASAVKRKRAASNTGPKPTNVKTFVKRTKKADGGDAMSVCGYIDLVPGHVLSLRFFAAHGGALAKFSMFVQLI